jgi:two-component system chemotaxis sensor kinase CheA
VDSLEAIKVTFFQECEEQLSELESGLLAMEGGDRDPETVNAVFRAVHSVKGGAGAFSLEPLVRFAHVFETTLDDIRANRLTADDRVVKVMLRAADVLADHVRAARDGTGVDEEHSATLAAELAALSGRGQPTAAADTIEGLDFQPVSFEMPSFEPAPVEIAAPSPVASSDAWIVKIRPRAALYAKANETALLLRELGRLGEMNVALDDSELPHLEELQPEEAYLVWTVRLSTEQDESAIREVFEFVDGDCDIEISREGAGGGSPGPSSGPPDLDIASLLAHVRASAPDIAHPPSAADEPAAPASEAPTAPASKAATPAPAAAPAAAGEPSAPAGAPGGPPGSQPGQTIRVDLERVDRLINLVGELVINQAMLAQRVTECGLARSSSVAVGLDDLEHLTREIQDSVMAIRAQPVKSVFQRMPRLAREVAAMTGKQVRLVTEGEATEVDKTVIERLADPITHMLRNAIDHGLESTEKRIEAGKPAEGTVKLAALHRGGRIVIELSDDGGGINRTRVRQVAIDKGLIAADAELTDEETDNLIFMPGFSTASTISDISGRGVGMDVVKRSVQGLGGRISITSRPGFGSTFTMSLPLTLAVLDGMVVSVAGQTLVAPLTSVVETLQPKPSNVRRLGPDSPLIIVRDTYVPLIDVGMKLGYRDQPLNPTSGVALLVETEGGGRAALLVDAIQGQRQVVIKSLEANYRSVVGIAAATILGDGRVALILDVDAVVAAQELESAMPMPAMAAAG